MDRFFEETPAFASGGGEALEVALNLAARVRIVHGLPRVVCGFLKVVIMEL
mgnify:CR=1|tara:strand:- start:338 stop:490 length:153 start_codon:yes stop_codon:yes gene_type:complete